MKKSVDKKNAISAKKVVFTSLIVDILDIILNLIVAILTGSVVMIAETLQGISDFMAVLFVIIGLKRSDNQSKKYPFGSGRALYIWIIFSTFLMILFASGLSIYFGTQRIIFPDSIDYLLLTYLVLGISIISNGYAFSLSSRRILNKQKYSSLFKIFKTTPLAETRTTLILDLTGFLAALFGLLALIFYGITKNPIYDGIGAILIGLTLLILSSFHLIKTKELLLGKSVSQKIKNKIKQIILSFPQVEKILDLKATHIGLDRILLLLTIRVKKDLNIKEVTKLIKEIKSSLSKKISSIKYIRIEISN